MQRSFLHCNVFSRLHEETAKGRALDKDSLKGQAVNRFAVSSKRADKFVDSFIKSVVAAGMAERNDQGQVVLLELEGEGVTDEDDEAEHEIGEPLPEPTPPPSPTAHRADPGLAAPAVHQSWPIDGGAIVLTIRTGGALPAWSFKEIGTIVGQLEELATFLNTKDGAKDGNEEIES